MMNNIKAPGKKRTHTSLLFLTLIVSFFCSIKTINVYLTRGMDTEGEARGPMALMYMASIAGIILVSLTNRQISLKRMSSSALLILVWIISFYFFTMFFIGAPYTSLPFFGVFTVASFLVPFLARVDGRLLLKFIMLFAVPAIFNLKEVFAPAKWYQDYISMGVSYSFLTPIVASVVYMFCYYSHENKQQRVITIIGLVSNIVYAYYLLAYGSRGPVLAILSTVLFLLLFKQNSKFKGVIKTKSNYFWIGIVVMVAAIFIPLLMQLQGFLSGSGISLRFVDKILNLNQEGNIANGRDLIYIYTLQAFLEKPFLGWGCDQFYNYYQDYTYPHNFLLQILYDGGILLLLILMVPLFKAMKRILKNCTYDEYAVYTALFFGSVPGALFSDDLWNNSFLWLFFGALLSKNFVMNKN